MLEVVRRIDAGDKYADIAAAFAVKFSCVAGIANGTRWAWLTGRRKAPPRNWGAQAVRAEARREQWQVRLQAWALRRHEREVERKRDELRRGELPQDALIRSLTPDAQAAFELASQLEPLDPCEALSTAWIALHEGTDPKAAHRTARRADADPPWMPRGVKNLARKLPPDRRRSWTQKAKIGNQTLYLGYGEYEDGTLCEIFLKTTKEGTFARGVLDALARTVSLALQNGVSVEEAVQGMRHLNFEPNGPVSGEKINVTHCSSIVDWVAQEVAVQYGARLEERATPKGLDAPPV